MLTTSLYTNIAFFILFQHYFSVLSNEVSAIESAAAAAEANVFGNASRASQLDRVPSVVRDDPLVAMVEETAASDAAANAVAGAGVSQVDGGGGGSAGGHQRLPVFPERTDAVYFVVAVVGGAKTWGRMLAKTLQDLGPPFNNPHGPPLRPIYVDMPPNGRFSSKVLTMFCQQTENRALAGIIVIGEGQSARAIALAGTSMKLPVLWAKGGTASLNGKHKEIETPFQAMLQPSAKEILEAVRAIFLQTHWHSFFVMSDMESSMVLKSTEGTSLHQAPLSPTILPLPARNGNIFKQLAEISKSTRGVVLLLCNLETARKIMSEAQRLNMVGGHFIWLWADTSSTTEFYDTASSSSSSSSRAPVGSLRGGVDVPGSSSQSAAAFNRASGSARDRSRQPLVTSSSASMMGRQRENERRTDQRGSSGNRGRKQPQQNQNQHQQQQGRTRENENKDNSRRERFHLPVAGRSRPVSEQNDKSRNRRDLANPTVASSSSPISSSPVLHNEQVASSPDEAEIVGAGDNEFYDDEQVFDSEHDREDDSSEHWGGGDDGDEGDEKEAAGYAESERRILELLRKAPVRSNGDSSSQRAGGTGEVPKESIRLAEDGTLAAAAAAVDDKWGIGNGTSSSDPSAAEAATPTPAKPSLSDIDPVIKAGKEDEEDAAKLKRMLNLSNMNNSDVLFHHFKDFPIGLLALRPVRMTVDRHFIKATVQLFANTWKHVDGAAGRAMEQSRSWQFDGERWRRKRRRRKRSDLEEETLSSTSDKLDVMDSRGGRDNVANSEWRRRTAAQRDLFNGAAKSEMIRDGREEGGRSLVNNTLKQLNQSFNASDLGKRVNYQRPRDPNPSSSSSSSSSSSMAKTNHGSRSIPSTLSPVRGRAGAEAGQGVNVKSGASANRTNLTDSVATHPESPVSLLSEAEVEVRAGATGDTHQQLDESGLQADYIIKSSDSYLKGDGIAQYKDDIDVEELLGSAESGGGDAMSSVQIKLKRKYGVSEQEQQQEVNRIRSGGANQRQQILGAWAKPGRSGSYNNNNPGGGGGGRRLGSPQYEGGCYGTPNKNDVKRAESFARLLRSNTQSVLEGIRLMDGPIEKSLITQFELLNLVPMNIKQRPSNQYSPQHQSSRGDSSSSARDTDSVRAHKSGLTKWRRVGLISGTNVHLDTIVWPGGDIVVSGVSTRPRSVFRVVTALAPPFVMESELDEDGLCLRGLLCHRLLATGHTNLTQIFNAIETRGRLEQDAIEHGWEVPDSEEDVHNPSYKTKCCYGLSMDLLENVATELGFEFHLYLVRDEMYGAKYSARTQTMQSSSSSSSVGGGDAIDETGQMTREPNSYGDVEIESDWDQTNDAEKKYFMSEDKIFGQKNQHIFYQMDHEGKRTQFNRDFTYMKERRLKDQSKHEQRQKLRNGEVVQSTKWNGIIGDLIGGSADMSFAALSVSKSRAEAIDFSAPYFHSGVSLLAAPQTKSEIPLLAFLLPFSPELWIAIFTSLNITAVAVAVYEWLSPFGLNPWGRQRNKNFSMSSALWVMWGLLCGHLVAFKAPKSWPNKFLINVWGGFSVIFVASYTANIAALIAGLFFQNAASKYEASLYTQRVGAPKASASEMYLQKNDRHLWEHMKKYRLHSLEEGVTRLKNGTLDLLMADSPILDYYRATDSGCNLQRIGETYVEDAYAIGMTKGFPLKDSISELIAKYSSNGYLDILTEKWYGGLPCFKLDREIVQPRPLELSALAGVYLLLGMGMILGVLILIFEHWFYKYTLPILRHKPNGTVWKSPNIMFFSQKLYRFINCVELVSPHHAARELVHTLRQGQIASLFQKSIKRKEDEQRRRRKSKAQFFEMIQEIRRINFLSRIQQQHEPPISEVDPSLELNAILSPDKLKVSPKPKGSHSRSRSNSSGLNVRRFSTDSILAVRLDTIGRRLSRDITNSPPDLGGRRFGSKDTLDVLPLSRQGSASAEMLTDTNKFDTSPSNGRLQPIPGGSATSGRKLNAKRTPLYLDVCYDRERERKKSADNIDILPTLKERLAAPICLIEPQKAELRDKLHDELKSKYAPGAVHQHSQTSRPSKVVAKPPRRGPLPLPPTTMTASDAGCSIESMPVPIPAPRIKVVRPDSLPCGGNTAAMVVGMTPKVRPTTSRHVTICTDAADQTVPGGSAAAASSSSSSAAAAAVPLYSTVNRTSSKRNGKSKLSREDLQMIQSGSQAEIDVYLQKSLRNKFSSAEPP